MNKRMTGYGRRWQAGRALIRATAAARMIRIAPLMLAVALGGCSLGRTTPQAQLFDLGPAPEVASASDATAGAMSGASGLAGTSSASFAASARSGSASPASARTSTSTPSLSIPGATARREALAVTFSASPMLADTGVIWRIGDSASPNSYATYRWAAPPSQLVRQRVIDRLSAAGPVVQDGVDPRAPLLQVTLTRFEQVYAPDGKSSTGQVALQAVLIRDHSVVDSVQLARGAPAPTQDAQGGVLALRAATDAASADLTAWVERRLSASLPPGSSISRGEPSTASAAGASTTTPAAAPAAAHRSARSAPPV